MTSIKDLTSIAEFYKTDKYEHGYTKVYEKYFESLREKKLQIAYQYCDRKRGIKK